MNSTRGLETDSGDGMVLFGYEPMDNFGQEIIEDNYEPTELIYNIINNH